MSKKIPNLIFSDIVLGADAETIAQALEARREIDRLLEERAKAYQQIAELESQVEELIGEETSFPFPEPPEPVFGFGPAKKVKKAKKKVAATPPSAKAPEPSADSREKASDDEGPKPGTADKS
ncbi:MAG: hypothetical protein JJT75_00030 [Opitutales bacterium]|nr:hypothetical protein [Opitutales bacterium]MCH8539479.1 hypothetical protein [Opitutales bacterium]